jgi:hypothetical protein
LAFANHPVAFGATLLEKGEYVVDYIVALKRRGEK